MYKDFKIIRSNIFREVYLIEPSVFEDNRGNIFTSYLKEVYSSLLPSGYEFIHDKFAFSKHNVLRGLHGDDKTWKLVSCIYGRIFEVVADVRKESPTFCKWESYELSSDKYRQILIPPGFVNGYYVLSENAVFHYKLAYEGEYVDAGGQITLRWNTPELGIIWPCKDPILQERDLFSNIDLKHI